MKTGKICKDSELDNEQRFMSRNSHAYSLSLVVAYHADYEVSLMHS